MNKRKNTIIVGGVILLSIGILIYGMIFLGDRKVGVEYNYLTVLFDDVGTLSSGDPVTINGVRKGKVMSTTIEPGSRYVTVIIKVEKGNIFPKDSRFIVQNVGLMGERMIGIKLGKSDEMLDITKPINGKFDSGIAEAMGIIGDVLEDAKQLLNYVRDIVNSTIGDPEFKARLNLVMQRADSLSARIDGMVARNQPILNRTIDNLDYTVSGVKGIFADKNESIKQMVSDLGATAGNVKEISLRADSLTKELRELVSKIQSGQGAAAELINNKEFYEHLKKTVCEADTLLKQWKKNGVDLNVDLW